MVELFHYKELKKDKVFSSPKKKEERYDFKELKEIRDRKGTKSNFALIYGQEHRIRGKKIIEAAEQLSSEIIEDAKNKVSEIEKAAYDKGARQAFEDGKQKLEPILSMFQEKLEELVQLQKNIYTKSEENILDLTLSLTSRIIHHEVRTHKDIILGSIKAAINKVLSRKQITICINPKDIEYVMQNKPKFKAGLEGIQQVSFKEDPSISKGSCIINTDFGSIVATIEKEFEELEKLLKKEFENSREKRIAGE